MEAADGKSYKTDVAETEQLFRLIQYNIKKAKKSYSENNDKFK